MKTNIIAALKAKMAYTSERQNVISHNIANANTPHFKAKDIKEPNFNNMVNDSHKRLSMTRTSSNHIASKPTTFGNYQLVKDDIEGVKPNGNNVFLEEQSFKMSKTAHDHKVSANLYKKIGGMIKTAINRRGG